VATTLQGAPEGEGQQQTPPAGQPSPDSSGQDDSVNGLSVEDVDARWRHRVSQKDKAHAAAEQALREENDRLKSQLSRPPSSGQSGTATNGAGNASNGDAEYWREQATQREREVEQERQLRQVESRRAKYPALAQQVGDAGSSIFATADDATLARLNALADDEATGSTFAPTTPRKAAPGKPKSLNEMDKSELEQELKRAVERGAHHR